MLMCVNKYNANLTQIFTGNFQNKSSKNKKVLIKDFYSRVNKKKLEKCNIYLIFFFKNVKSNIVLAHQN